MSNVKNFPSRPPKALGGMSDLAMDKLEEDSEDLEGVQADCDRLATFLSNARQPEFVAKFRLEMEEAEKRRIDLDRDVNGDPLEP